MLDPQHSVAGYFAVRHQELRAAAGHTAGAGEGHELLADAGDVHRAV
jgi:hypothetical protein